MAIGPRRLVGCHAGGAAPGGWVWLGRSFRPAIQPRVTVADRDQIVFGLYLSGAEMMLAAFLHGVHVWRRQMLLRAARPPSRGQHVVLDRGYPARWRVALLNQRGIHFCMRVEKRGNNGFTCVRDFLPPGLTEQVVAHGRRIVAMLPTSVAPSRRRPSLGTLPDAERWGVV